MTKRRPRTDAAANAPGARSRRATPRMRADDFEASWVRSAITGLVVVQLVSLVLFVSRDGFEEFLPPKSALSQAIGYLLVALLALAFLRYGRDILPRTRLHALPVAYGVVALASIPFSADRTLAVYGDITVREGAIFVLDMIALYLAVAVAFRGKDARVLLGLALIGATVVTLGVATLQLIGRDPLLSSFDTRARTHATFGNADIFAQYLGAVVGAVAGALLFAGAGRRLLLAAFAIACLAIGGTTGGRAFLISVGIVAVAAAILAAWVYRERLSAGRAALSGGAVVALGAALLFVTPAGARVLASLRGEGLVLDRLLAYQRGWLAFLDRPALGWGLGNFEPASVAHPSAEMVRLFGPHFYFTSAHDIVLTALVNAGILGLLALVALYGAFVVVLARRGLAGWPQVAAPLLLAIAGYLGGALFSIESPAVDWIPWTAFGLTAALAGSTPDRLPARRRIPLPAVVVAIVAGILAAGTQLPAYLANDAAGAAARSSAAKQHVAAVQAAERAIALQRDEPRYWQRYALVLGEAGRTREAGDAFAQAAARAPYHSDHWNNLAVARAQQAQAGDLSSGGWAAAREAAEEALRRDPFNSSAFQTLAFIQDGTGDRAAALASIAHAIELYQQDAAYDRLLEQIAPRVPDAQLAFRTTEQVASVKGSIPIHLAAARAALRVGDAAAARVHLLNVLMQDPANRQAQDLLRSIPAGAQP